MARTIPDIVSELRRTLANMGALSGRPAELIAEIEGASTDPIEVVEARLSRKVISSGRAAAIANVDKQTITRWCRLHHEFAFKMGGRWKLDHAKFMAFIGRRRRE